MDYKAQIELARQSLLIRELFASFQKKNPVTDAEVKAEYDKFVAGNSGKEYRARHILVEKEEQAKAIIASLKKGGKFEDIAKKQSKDPGSGANGGDLDWAAPGNYVKEFSEAMVALRHYLAGNSWAGAMSRLQGYQPHKIGAVTALSAELPWWSFKR